MNKQLRTRDCTRYPCNRVPKTLARDANTTETTPELLLFLVDDDQNQYATHRAYSSRSVDARSSVLLNNRGLTEIVGLDQVPAEMRTFSASRPKRASFSNTIINDGDTVLVWMDRMSRTAAPSTGPVCQMVLESILQDIAEPDHHAR